METAAVEQGGKLLKKLTKMRRADLLIACIALAQKALLVTRNTKDFKDVPGLTFAHLRWRSPRKW